MQARPLAMILALLGLAVLGGCGGSRPASSAPASSSASGSSESASAPARPARRHHRHHRDPGTLPQTHQLPSSHTATFQAEMRALFDGVRAGRPHLARPAFFPERAYAQVKAIADPAGDFRDRLLAGYASDIAAAHAFLDGGAAGVHLVGVRVPQAYAHWVEPGTCSNRIGYWEVPNARVVVRQGHGVRSFGIASMISWRGVWYVVHLGSVGGSGVVDDPAEGPGVSADSSTC